MNQLIASAVFGPEYDDSDFEIIASPKCDANSALDISYTPKGEPQTKLLPPGGYVIKYISGALLLLGSSPAEFVVGGKRGIQISWKSNVTHLLSSSEFPIREVMSNQDAFTTIEQTVDRLFCIEFTVPHRLMIVAPANAVGSVKFRVLRFKPKD